MGTVDDALATYPPADGAALARVIDLARRVAPDAQEGTSYGVPALRVSGKPLIGVSRAAGHLALYPFSPAAIDAVRDGLEGFDVSKGTVRFTAEHPVPDDVLERLVRARLAEIR